MVETPSARSLSASYISASERHEVDLCIVNVRQDLSVLCAVRVQGVGGALVKASG